MADHEPEPDDAEEEEEEDYEEEVDGEAHESYFIIILHELAHSCTFFFP